MEKDLREQVAEMVDTLRELTDLMDAVHNHEYTPDCFTTQPARNILKEAEKLLALLSVPVEWPKKREHDDTCGSRPEWYDKQNWGMCDCTSHIYNNAIDACLLAHNSIIAEKEREIAELKEYKERIEPFMEELVLLSDGKDVVSDDQLLKEVIDKLKAKDSEIAHLKAIIAQDYTAGRMTELEAEIARLRKALLDAQKGVEG